jgi:hypothetical protein
LKIGAKAALRLKEQNLLSLLCRNKTPPLAPDEKNDDNGDDHDKDDESEEVESRSEDILQSASRKEIEWKAVDADRLLPSHANGLSLRHERWS